MPANKVSARARTVERGVTPDGRTTWETMDLAAYAAEERRIGWPVLRCVTRARSVTRRRVTGARSRGRRSRRTPRKSCSKASSDGEPATAGDAFSCSKASPRLNSETRAAHFLDEEHACTPTALLLIRLDSSAAKERDTCSSRDHGGCS